MRPVFILVLIVMIVVAGCGGGGSGDGASSDGSPIPAGVGGSGSDSDATLGDGDLDPESTAGEAGNGSSDGTGGGDPTATSRPSGIVQLTRTPRPTSTPFPTPTTIAVAPTPVGGNPTATVAREASVEIISTHVFRNPDAGSAIIFGEVQNTGDVAATGVQIRATLFDGAGSRVGRGESESVGKTVMNPGDVTGFSIIVTFDDGYAEWVTEEITASSNVSRPESVAAYTPNLSISGETLVGPSSGFDFVDVTGNITNDSGVALRFVQVGAIAYDGAGNVISVDSFVSSDILEPGATIPFSVEFSRGRLKDFPASYALVVEGLAVE